MVPAKKDWNNFWGSDKSSKFQKISWSKKRIVKKLSPYIKPGMSFLDAGCGSGFFSAYYCERDVHVVAVDYSEQALNLVKKITQKKVDVFKADMVKDELHLSIQRKFDVIFSDGLFEHFSREDQNRIISNLKSVLKKDGVLITFVPNKWSPWQCIRPFFMPGIDEEPFTLKALQDLNVSNELTVLEEGGVNTLPFKLSPEKFFGKRFGMLLYTIAKVAEV